MNLSPCQALHAATNNTQLYHPRLQQASSTLFAGESILDFQDYYQETAKPFDWKFTAADLEARLDALKNFAAT